MKILIIQIDGTNVLNIIRLSFGLCSFWFNKFPVGLFEPFFNRQILYSECLSFLSLKCISNGLHFLVNHFKINYGFGYNRIYFDTTFWYEMNKIILKLSYDSFWICLCVGNVFSANEAILSREKKNWFLSRWRWIREQTMLKQCIHTMFRVRFSVDSK